MKTRYKILIIGIIIISVLLFLQAPSIMGQPECNDGGNRSDYDCNIWSNWDWIYYNMIERDVIDRTVYPSRCIGCKENVVYPEPELKAHCTIDFGFVWIYQYIINPLCDIGIKIPNTTCICIV